MTTQEPDETGSDLEATAFPAETAETQLAADDARPHSRARSLIFAVGGAVAIAVAAAGVGFGLGQLTHHRHGTPATQPRAGKASASPTATVNGLTFSAFQLVLPPTFEGMHLWAAPNASANSTPTATPYPQPLKAFGHVDDQGASYQDTQGSKSVSVGGMADRSVVQQNPFDGYSFYDQFNSDRPLSDLRDYPSGRLGGVLRCGRISAMNVVCGWSDDNMLIFLNTANGGFTEDGLAAFTLAFRNVAEVPLS